MIQRILMRLLIAGLLLTRLGLPGPCMGECDGTSWSAVDALGRTVASPGEAPPIREDRTVGIFYFLWMLPDSNIPADPNGGGEPYDITKILEKDPTAFRREDDALFGKNGEMHFWGQPLYGYYDSRDPWVTRRHLILLADAGVDLLMFDATNGALYPEVWKPMLQLMKQMRQAGEATPQIAFVLHTRPQETADALWRELYADPGPWEELLFRWEGKPLLMADSDQVSEELRSHFTFRRTRWQYEGMANGQNAWTWIALYPQPYAYSQNPKIPEQISVSTAQNLTRFGTDVEARKKVFKETTGWDCPEWLYSFDGEVPGAGLDAWMCDGTARGRSFAAASPGKGPEEGANFSEQWSRAHDLDPPFVMVTGWNEWIAGRWKVAGHYIFIDQFNQEYSRDIEPMRGGHFDNYYIQMVDQIRRYKGMPPRLSARVRNEGDLPLDDFSAWQNVAPVFYDHRNETAARDFSGVGAMRYYNDSGRNDLQTVKTAEDPRGVHFYLQTAESIRPTRPDGLCLLIDTDADLSTGWNGGDLMIGRRYGEKTVSAEECIETSADIWHGCPAGEIDYKIRGNELLLTVPHSFFADQALTELRFKWLDHLPYPPTSEDLYLSGDVAPESRFFYQIEFFSASP